MAGSLVGVGLIAALGKDSDSEGSTESATCGRLDRMSFTTDEVLAYGVLLDGWMRDHQVRCSRCTVATGFWSEAPIVGFLRLRHNTVGVWELAPVQGWKRRQTRDGSEEEWRQVVWPDTPTRRPISLYCSKCRKGCGEYRANTLGDVLVWAGGQGLKVFPLLVPALRESPGAETYPGRPASRKRRRHT